VRRPGAHLTVLVFAACGFACGAGSSAASDSPPTEIVFIQPSKPSAPIADHERESDAHRYSQSLPDVALRSFIRAYEDHRYDVLLRFIPKRHLTGPDALTETRVKEQFEGPMREGVEARIAALKQALDKRRPWGRDGSRATILSEGTETLLVLEDGVWKVEDL
jgi:hypothetical protein